MSELANVAKEYEKNQDLKQDDVDNLRLWAEKQPHLPKISELQYILFLQSCYYSYERTKSAIENYFTMRTLCRDIFAFTDTNEPGMQMVFDVGLVSILPNVAPSGFRVVFMKLLDTNPEKYIFLDQIKMFDRIVTLFMHLQGTNEGFHIVFDLEGACFSHLMRFTPIISKKYVFYVQEALPIRLRDIHLIRAPSWIDKALAFFKPLLKKELFEMINIHLDINDFYKVVPQVMMPEEYGGRSASCKVLAGENRRRLEQNRAFFEEQDKQITDESKRVGKSTDFNKIFGLEGSFKKLEVD